MTSSRTTPRRLARHWPWLVLALAVVPAVWHVVDFESDTDPEYPLVVRPTFSAYPPAAYRLAEPGDTIDRIALYLSAVAAALALGGWGRSRARGEPAALWPGAAALALAACWHTMTPGPGLDGWHGLGWRTMLDPATPAGQRATLLAAAAALAGVFCLSLFSAWPRRRELREIGRERGVIGLSLFSAALVALRQVDPPGLEPAGYWPRWAFVWGLFLFVFALIRAFPPAAATRAGRWGWRAGIAATAAGLIGVGLAVVWYHRPVDRLKAAVPGKIFISAMPTPAGLEVAHRRHGFRTIINLFPEHTDRRSPHFPAEVQFAREHGIRYLLSPEDPDEAEAFLDRTLAAARDPDAWPILVHCHGCMDRTPAWLGIYRFLDEGRSLADVLREIEQHRGYRPKASVTLLYNHALTLRAPERYAADPTGRLLLRNAAGSPTPYDERTESGEPESAVSRRNTDGDPPRR